MDAELWDWLWAVLFLGVISEDIISLLFMHF